MECFAVYADEIKGRIDPHYYKPEFIELEEQLSKFKNKTLEELIKFSNEIWNQKDIYNKKFIRKLSAEIKKIYPGFNEKMFVENIFNKEWKIGFGKRHWLFRGFVYLMIAGGIWNIFSSLVWILVALIG